MQKTRKRAFIWLVRHGQAQGNGMSMLNGSRIDAPLTGEGLRQAKQLAQSFPFKPDALLSSPLTRAVATARVLAKKWKLQLHYTKLAQEQDFGENSGHWMADILARHPSYFRNKGHFMVKCPGGEDWPKLKKRAARFLAWLDHQYAGKRVVVITHADFMNSCYQVRFGLSDEKTFHRHEKPNCSWMRL